MKKSLKYLIYICLTSVLFVSCGTNSERIVTGSTEKSQSVEQINIKLWHIWTTDSEASKQPFEISLKDFENRNPDIKIDVEAIENETYKTKIRTAMTVNEVPDIFYSWGAGFSKPFIDAGKVLALDDYINDGTKEKLLPESLKYFTFDKKVYGLPIYMIAGIFYYNKEIFERNGLKIPDTFDELVEVSKQLNEKGVTPIVVGEKDGWPGIFFHNILALRTAGIVRCNAALNKKTSFDSPDFTQAAEKLCQLIDAQAFDKRSMQMTRDEAEACFKNGGAAMYYNGSWYAGTLDKEDSAVKGKIEVRNFPVLTDGLGSQKGYLGGAIDTFMVSSDTKYKDQAVYAVKTISEEFCKQSYYSGAGIPAWKIDENIPVKSQLAGEISKLVKDRDCFMLVWDTYLAGEEAQTHINLVADLFSSKLTPKQFSAEMQKMNETSSHNK